MKAIKNAIGPKVGTQDYLIYRQVMSYFDTMAEVVMGVPQSVLAQVSRHTFM